MERVKYVWKGDLVQSRRKCETKVTGTETCVMQGKVIADDLSTAGVVCQSVCKISVHNEEVIETNPQKKCVCV